MMRLVVRATGWLLLLALAALSWWQQEIHPVLAGLAIAGLVETALALRARRSRPDADADADRSRLDAVEVSCTEADGALSVALRGADPRRGRAPCMLLTRTQAVATDAGRPPEGPCLELSDRRGSVRGGIQEASLSPQRLSVTPDARSAQVLGASTIHVSLPAGTDQRRLERALGRILRGVPFTSERSLPEDTPGRAPGAAA